MKHTLKQPSVHLFAAGFLVAILITGALRAPVFTNAQSLDDAVCGDGVLSIGEQCDDANLVSGDGCSNQCQIEECGNGVVDVNEQCDDDNTINNDGCSAQCFIEFCGDGIVQELRGEACDDGGTINGDGCSSTCVVETQLEYCPYTVAMNTNLQRLYNYFMIITGNLPQPQNQTISAKWDENDYEFIKQQLLGVWEPRKPMLCVDYKRLQGLLSRVFIFIRIRLEPGIIFPEVPEVSVDEVDPAIDTPEVGVNAPVSPQNPTSNNPTGGTRGTREEQVKQATEFLSTATGKGVYDRLTPAAKKQLDEILQRYAQGRGLTQAELAWVASLAEQIQLAKNTEQKLYTDLLDRFTATDISKSVLEANQLLREKLVDVEIPIAIEELQKAVAIVARGELKNEVARAVARLERQRVAIDSTPLTATPSFDAGARPIEAFAALVALKDSAESFATPSIPLSAERISIETEKVRNALPYLVESYDISVPEVTALLDLIDIRSRTVDVHSAERYVATVNRLLSLLHRSGIDMIDDPASFALITTDTIARADRVVSTYAPRSMVASLVPTLDKEQTQYEQLSPVASFAKDAYRPAFAEGGTDEQRQALLAFLETNDRVQYLRETLAKRGDADDAAFTELVRSIRRIGEDDLIETACDDSIQAGLDCADAYMSSLQASVRSSSMWTRIVGSVQDLFGM